MPSSSLMVSGLSISIVINVIFVLCGFIMCRYIFYPDLCQINQRLDTFFYFFFQPRIVLIMMYNDIDPVYFLIWCAYMHILILIWYFLLYYNTISFVEELSQKGWFSLVVSWPVGRNQFTKTHTWKMMRVQLIKNSNYLKSHIKILQQIDGRD